MRVAYCAPHLRACMSSIMSLFYFGETDKNMTCTRTYATLRVFSKDMHPNDITEVLGVVPTGSRPIETNSKYKNRREFHLWKYTTEKLSDSVDNLKHLELILSALKGKEQQMRMLHEQSCVTDIFCFWDSTGQGGPSLGVELMEQLVKHGLEISWDIYFDNEENA